jgi:hypothetical protein
MIFFFQFFGLFIFRSEFEFCLIKCGWVYARWFGRKRDPHQQ